MHDVKNDVGGGYNLPTCDIIYKYARREVRKTKGKKKKKQSTITSHHHARQSYLLLGNESEDY